MRVLLSTYGSRGDVQPMVGLAVRLWALGAEVRGVRRPTSRSCCRGAGPSSSPRRSTRTLRRLRDVLRWRCAA